MAFRMSHRYAKTNPFTRLLADSIEHVSGKKVEDFHLRDFLKIRKGDVVHLHWFSPLYHGKTRFEMRFKAFLLDTYFRLIKLKGASLFWTVNNLVAHDAEMPGLELEITRAIIKRFDYLFVFGAPTREKLIAEFGVSEEIVRIIPHGSYRAYYEACADNDRIFGRPSAFDPGPVYLFFGLLRPYKGIENLIEAFNGSGRNLLIAGGGSLEYVEKLRSINKSPMTYIDARRIPDEEIASLMRIADAVILPFSYITMSGSMILALSFHVPVISVSDGDVPFYIEDGKNGFLLKDNSVESIRDCINRPFQKGENEHKSYDRVEHLMDWNNIGSAIHEAYRAASERR